MTIVKNSSKNISIYKSKVFTDSDQLVLFLNSNNIYDYNITAITYKGLIKMLLIYRVVG